MEISEWGLSWDMVAGGTGRWELGSGSWDTSSGNLGPELGGFQPQPVSKWMRTL